MNSFILSQKDVPDLVYFGNKIKELYDSFDGILDEDGVKTILFTEETEVTQEMIDDIELIDPTVPLQVIIAKRIDEAAREGSNIADEMRNLVGAKNVILNKSEEEVIQIVVALSGAQSLLKNGALYTARTVITQSKPAFPEYSEEFDLAVLKINTFLGVT